jgi:hypothetical protein
MTTEQIFSLVSIFSDTISFHLNNDEVLQDITKGLSKLSGSNNHKVLEIAAAKHTGLFGIMCDLLCHKNQEVFKEALVYVGGIMSAEDEWTNKMMIQNDVIEKITNVMYSANSEVIKNGLWTLSNIVASNV